MNTEHKKQLIGRIISTMRFEAKRRNKPFDEGDVFFSLCFKTDDELTTIARLAHA